MKHRAELRLFAYGYRVSCDMRIEILQALSECQQDAPEWFMTELAAGQSRLQVLHTACLDLNQALVGLDPGAACMSLRVIRCAAEELEAHTRNAWAHALENVLTDNS